ncbi:efflux RND transporter periplasmic adaptor subunit [Curvibacter sp. CHRR-16]|uniref:efflux RND transporter periplasmic adaptor subunit n=1 Tax=Curvibacter sp. CHRR-16 TaxID=2835872 RepID=UPI001BDA88BB|nr:efflux RND transporter periplasmic adaptor subunit [Curvibacter sp. CHRR-16]MBT0570976.1 efflux RND transporter periplasmic adaptor subunit [Curvibacter sp. CHRR-16]
MKRWFGWIALVVVVALLAAGVVRALASRKAQQDALQQQTASMQQAATLQIRSSDIVTAQELELTQTLPLTGTIKAANTAIVKARVSGELQDLSVREGDFVKAGQVLARVVSSEYAARVQQAQQQAQAAQTQVDIAQRNYDNNKALVNQGFISPTALQSSLATLQGAQATYQAALAAVDVNRQAANDSVLRAPISGQISQRMAQPGERVAPDARIVEVVDLSKLELEATLEPAQSLQVRVGQTAQLHVDGSTDLMDAKIMRINPAAQAGSRAVLAYLSLPSSAGLRQGLFMQGQLLLGKAKGVALPLDAVRTDKPAPYVQWLDKNTVQHQNVQVTTQGLWKQQPYVLVQGLRAGVPVLMGSVGTLRAGTPAQEQGGH